MLDSLGSETMGFIPHGHCFLWTPSLLWTYVLSQSTIALSYYSIPFALWYFARKRQDLPYRKLFILFGMFVMACGTTHLIGILTIWQPVYILDASVMAFTAMVSLIAAIAIWRVMPQALSIPSRAQLENTNNNLQIEIGLRKAEEARSAQLLAELKYALADNQRFTQEIIDNAPVLIYSLDNDGRFTLANKCLLSLFGLNRDQFIGHAREDVMPKQIAQQHRNNDIEVISKGTAIEVEENNIEADGMHSYLSKKFPLFDVDGNISGVCGISTDITARKKAEVDLRRANRALLTLGSGNGALIRSTDESQLLEAICFAAVDIGGYRMAWIGYVEQNTEKSIRTVASKGQHEEYVKNNLISWADSELGQGPSGRAVRSGMAQVAQNIAQDPTMFPWRDEALRCGFSSSIALPLLENDRCFGVLTIYSDETEAFDSNEVKLLEEMANDLAFGIVSLRIKNSHKNQESRLNKSMLQTIEAIASIVEMRDPYTSGHQGRVAKLAQAIAQAMRLPEDYVYAIHLAGLVHDLGKIKVPSEILSKPRRLDEIEYMMIKEHPQTGFDILNAVDFTLPIAQMVLQHHEHMDGSGYPQGLKGSEILLGARILCVADVVEAMSSHRPYRPGLGIEAALDEISKNRGALYDPQVVDACVNLFKNEAYVIPK